MTWKILWTRAMGLLFVAAAAAVAFSDFRPSRYLVCVLLLDGALSRFLWQPDAEADQ